MFFPFFSKREYAEDQWSAIWDVESAIHGLLMEPEYLNKLRYLPKEEFLIHLDESLREVGYLGHFVSESTSSEWIDDFLKKEVDALFEFIQGLGEMPVADIQQSLRPCSERIVDCAKKSKLFREYLSRRAQLARQWLKS